MTVRDIPRSDGCAPLPNRPAGRPPGPASHQRNQTSAECIVTTDVTRIRTAPEHRRATWKSTPAASPPERAQLVWRRRLSWPIRWRNFALALDLLRAVHHDPATMAHALTLGRTHLRAGAHDAVVRDGARILEAAIAFLGVKPRTGDVAGLGRR